MKRMIGLLMVMGLMVDVVGCGDDDNPVKSDVDRLVGTWIDQEDYEATFKSDGTYVYTGVDYFEEGTWSLEGDELTLFNDKDGEDGYTFTLMSVTDTEFITMRENGENEPFTRKNQVISNLPLDV